MALRDHLSAWFAPRTQLCPTWQDEAVWCDGDAWFTALIAAIEGAQRSVRCETYILADDVLGRRVLAALAAARARGCAVLLLVDGVGSGAWLAAGRPGGAGLEVRVWNPMPWAAVRRAGLQRRWRWLIAINRRDHRKLCLIDDEQAWVGSFNCDGCHVRSVAGDQAWRDSGAAVRGAGVGVLAAAFDHAWKRSWPVVGGHLRPPVPRLPRPPAATCPTVRLNYTGAVRRAAYRDLLARLRAARSRIWITNAYVVPRGSLVRTLAAAARRGVDVRLLAPARSDVAFMPWIGAIYAEALLARGVRVFAYLPRMLHAKTMLIDDDALVGSHNLNSRSFLHDLEAEVVLSAPSSITALEQAFLTDCTDARELRRPVHDSLPWWQLAIGRTMLLAKRWL